MSGPDRQAWLNWLKTFDVKGKYKLSDDDYEALQKWNSVHNSLDEVTIEQKIEAENELDEYLQGNPIGSLDDISDVEEFFKDADKRKAFSEMKVVPDGSRRATPSSKPMLEELFYQSGKPTDLIRNKYGGKTELESEKKLKELYHLLRDEQYDSNKLRIEDVIELLREIEYEYKGSAKLNMVVSSMRQAQLEEEDTRFDTVWDKGIHILLKGVEDNYVGIRKSFLNAIKDVMVEESKRKMYLP